MTVAATACLAAGACKKKDADDTGGGGSAGMGAAGRGGSSGGGAAGTSGAGGASGSSGGAVAANGFALGVEYTEKGLAAPFGALGVGWAKTRLEAFAWGAIEKAAPPAGGVHSYDWTCTDALIREYQTAGMVHIQSYLTPKSAWGSKSATDPMPKPEVLPDYRAWIAAMFERYDGDGNADMPGLAAPVQHWVVGGEWTGFWGSGNADDYIALATATSEAGRAAYPDVKLGAIPLMMWDVFQGDAPDEATVATRLKDPPPAWRNSTAGLMKILDRGDLFDELDVHSLGDYTELAPMMRWLKAQMASRGYSKPVYIDDAFPAAFLVTVHASGSILAWPSVYPATAADERAIYDQLFAVASMAAPGYAPAKAWWDGEVAKSLVKKIVTARAEGYAGIQIGNTEDWMQDAAPLLRQTAFNLIGADAMMGLIEVSHAGGYDFCQMRTPGAQRPAAYTLGLLIEKLGPTLDGTVTSLVPSGVDSTRVYLFQRTDGRQVYVAWNEPRHLVLPGQPDPPVVAHLLGAQGTRARVTRVATALPANRAALESDLTLTPPLNNFEVTSVPVIVEPLP